MLISHCRWPLISSSETIRPPWPTASTWPLSITGFASTSEMDATLVRMLVRASWSCQTRRPFS